MSIPEKSFAKHDLRVHFLRPSAAAGSAAAGCCAGCCAGASMQPLTTDGVAQLLDERATFLRANLQAGVNPDVQQMTNFLATLAAQTGQWAGMPSTAPEQRDGMLQMFLSVNWDCINNGPVAHRSPPLPSAVLAAVERMRWELVSQRVRWQQQRQPQQPRQPTQQQQQQEQEQEQQQQQTLDPPRKRRRGEPPQHSSRPCGPPPVFGAARKPGSPPAVLLVFDLNGTLLTRRRAAPQQYRTQDGERKPVLLKGRPLNIRPHLSALLETIAASSEPLAESGAPAAAGCSLAAAVWTSAMVQNMLPMVSAALGPEATLALRFTAHREHCSLLSRVLDRLPASSVLGQAAAAAAAAAARAGGGNGKRPREHETVKNLDDMWAQQVQSAYTIE